MKKKKKIAIAGGLLSGALIGLIALSLKNYGGGCKPYQEDKKSSAN